MIRRTIGSSLRVHRAVIVAAVAIMAFGIVQLRDANVEVLPEFDPPTVRVQTDALGLSAEEVEQLVTVPIEQDLLDGVAWLDSIHSKSVPGLSYVELVFKPGTNIYRARQVVQERISQAAGLPNVSRTPQMLQPLSSTSRTAMVTLSSKNLTAIQLGVLARWTIRPRLLAVPGVSTVAIWGQRERQLQVLVDPAKLKEKNVTMEQVVTSTGNALWVSPLTFLEASTPGTGGFIDTPNQRLGIQHNLPVIKPDDLAKIAIDETAGLSLGDVATVVEDHQPLIGDAVVKGDGTFLLAVEKLPNANTAEVTRGVEAALNELRPGLTGVTVDTSIFRPTTYIDKSLDNLRLSVIVGAALLVLAFALLFLRWRTALIAVVSVFASFTVAATVLQLFGRTFNALVFAGLVIAIGAVVDDAVRSAESATRHMVGVTTGSGDQAPDSPRHRLFDAALEVGRTSLWATIMFIVALLPIAFMNGVSGDSFFPPLAAASVVALVASLVVVTTVTPALCLLLLTGERSDRKPPLSRLLERGYQRLFSTFTRSAIPALAVMGLLFVAGALAIPSFDKALLPRLKDTNLLVQWQAPFGTSLTEMGRIINRASTELRTVPGVRTVGAQVGQAVSGDQPVGSDSAQMWVSIDPSAEYEKTVNEVRRVVAGYPGMEHRVTTYAAERLRKTLGRSSDEISVRVFGQDLGVLHTKAEEVRKMLSAIGGISGARVTSREAEPTIQVEVDLDKAKTLGIKPGDVRRAAETLLSGLKVGNLFQDQKIFDVTVWGQPETRTSLTSVRDLLIDTPGGKVIRVGDVADVTVRATSPVIEHEDVSRYVDVTANVKSRSVGAVAREVRRALVKVPMPVEYHAELLADYSREQNAQRRVAGFAIAAAIGVFLLLQAAFNSWRLAALALATIVLSLVGGLVAAWIYGGPMTLATIAGLLAVLALAIRGSVTLVDEYLTLRREGAPLDVELVQLGARQRLAPTLTTAVVTALVLLPALVLGDVAGQEILHPMVAVIMGGLVTSVVMSLLVLPSLYLRFGPRGEPRPWTLDLVVDEVERELIPAAAGGN